MTVAVHTGTERGRKGSGALAPVVPHAMNGCYFAFRVTARKCSGNAVVWIADGRGSCGAHHQDLARMRTVEL